MTAPIDLARTLHRQNRSAEAIALLDGFLADHPGDIEAQRIKTGALVRLRRFEEAVAVAENIVKSAPDSAVGWVEYGHLLKTVGRTPEGVAAFRKSVEIDPGMGAAWWALANLKTVRLGPEDVAAMEDALAGSDPDPGTRIHLHFALGKALADNGSYEKSFAHYSKGNAIRRAGAPHDAQAVSRYVATSETLFSGQFFEQRAGAGHVAPDPIFIIGMPRSGSTLVEQMLASHPMIEGMEELFDIQRLAQNVAARLGANHEAVYFESLARLPAHEFRTLGENYLASTRAHRRTSRPYFTDKMPNNWGHLGLIHLILPNARIIDVRRHPMACCFSNFTQHFEWGQNFAYDLQDLGRYYRDYVRMLDHFDRILPGRVHRIFYEKLVEEPEGEVRRLLDHLGLPFDEACLRFHENRRVVHTPSSEQVRRPINREGMDSWRTYERWLSPLKEALGPVLDLYPETPERWPD